METQIITIVVHGDVDPSELLDAAIQVGEDLTSLVDGITIDENETSVHSE